MKSEEAWLGFFGAFTGAAVAVIGAYVLNQLNKRDETNEKNKLAELIVNNFLKHEIEENFEACGFEYLRKNFTVKKGETIQFCIRSELMSFSEI